MLLFLLLNAAMMPTYALCLGPARRWRRPVQVAWSRACCALASLKVGVSGAGCGGGATLFVANHVSYLDIPVLASLIDGAFVAKSEVADWPLFGTAARLTRTVFVTRAGPEAKAQQQELKARLAGGENLILFAEGTSTDGSGVAPFKTALFSIAERPIDGRTLVIQPVSIAYPRYADGRPLVGPLRALYCWFGEATLVPHLFRVLGLKGAEVEVRFHPPIRAGNGTSRKALAKRAEQAVADGVALANAGLEVAARTAAA